MIDIALAGEIWLGGIDVQYTTSLSSLRHRVD